MLLFTNSLRWRSPNFFGFSFQRLRAAGPSQECRRVVRARTKGIASGHTIAGLRRKLGTIDRLFAVHSVLAIISMIGSRAGVDDQSATRKHKGS